MLGRVTMAFGHRALHFVQLTLYYLPEPFGLPFGREHFVVIQKAGRRPYSHSEPPPLQPPPLQGGPRVAP